jgi:hypothetical protein
MSVQHVPPSSAYLVSEDLSVPNWSIGRQTRRHGLPYGAYLIVTLVTHSREKRWHASKRIVSLSSCDDELPGWHCASNANWSYTALSNTLQEEMFTRWVCHQRHLVCISLVTDTRQQLGSVRSSISHIWITCWRVISYADSLGRPTTFH